MAKVGLAALADGYALQRAESDECKQLGQRFFELIGDFFAPFVARRVKPVGGVGVAIETFAEFCSGSKVQHTFVLIWAEKPALTFRIDHQLVLGLLDGVLGGHERAGHDAATSATEAPDPLTPTEARIVGNVLRRTLCTVVPQVFEGFPGVASGPPAIRARDEAGLVLETLEPAEMMVAMAGQYSMNGRGGAIAVGLTLASVAARRADSAPPADVRAVVDGAGRARTMLADARIPLTAVMGSVDLPLTAVETLSCGSIIPLGQLRGRAPRIELRIGEYSLWIGTVIAECGWYRFLVRQGEESIERSDNRI